MTLEDVDSVVIDDTRFIRPPKFIGTCGHSVVDHYKHVGDCGHDYIEGWAVEVRSTGCTPKVVWWCGRCDEYVDLQEVDYEARPE